MLGRDIYDVLSEVYEVVGVDLRGMPPGVRQTDFVGDLTDRDFLDQTLRAVNPDMIIHCAAIVNLMICEENRDLTNRLHLDVTSQLTDHGAPIIFISTDSVFDGKQGNYHEEDQVGPVNYYGLSKWKGEEIVRRNPKHLILRTNIFGSSCPLGGSIAEWAIKNFIDGSIISGFTDVYFNSIYTNHLAEIIRQLIEGKVHGTFHAGSSNIVSKYSFLKYLEAKLMGSSKLVACSQSSEIQIYPERPINPTLNVDKLKKLVDVPTVEDCIDALVKDYLEVKYECNSIGR